MRAAYAKSGDPVADQYLNWRRYNTTPYVSETHGNRHVNNYANGVAKAYGKFEKAGVMPVGSVLAKDSFSVRPNGQAVLGPLFIMEKMQKGFNPESGDWRNTMIMPDGNIFGTTGGKGSANVKFCYECHTALTPDTDSLFFMPAEYRAKP